MDIDKEAVGRRIKQLREQRGLSQKDLGALVGADNRQVWRWEAGRTLISTENLARVAAALGVSPHLILHGRPHPGETAWELFLSTPEAEQLSEEQLERLRTQRLEFLGGDPTVEDYRALARMLLGKIPIAPPEPPPPHNLNRLVDKRERDKDKN